MSPTEIVHNSRRTVECPECGQEFDPRGFPAHLRWKHPHDEAGPLPSRGDMSRFDRALAMLAQGLAGVERRLERIEAKLTNAISPPAGDAVADARALLARELEQVLAMIEQLKIEERANDTATPSRRLGQLRRRQANLLYQIAELSPEGRARAEASGIGTLF